MLRRFVLLLPLLVVLAGIGLFAFYFTKQRNVEKNQMARKETAVAEKTCSLPISADAEDVDRIIAEKAFASPERVDSAPPVHYGKPNEMEMLYADPATNLEPAATPVKYQPRQPSHQTSLVESGQANASFVQENLGAGKTNERVDPESEIYRERVDDLMGMRHRRLQGKAGRNE